MSAEAFDNQLFKGIMVCSKMGEATEHLRGVQKLTKGMRRKSRTLAGML